jgi:transcriptional regulator with AAA-type ATPase domain
MKDEALALVYTGSDIFPYLALARLPLASGTPIPKGIYLTSREHFEVLAARSDFTTSGSAPTSTASLSARALGNAHANDKSDHHLVLDKEYQVTAGQIPNSLRTSLRHTWLQLEGSSQHGDWQSQRCRTWRDHPESPPVIVVVMGKTHFERLTKSVSNGEVEVVEPDSPNDEMLAKAREYFWGSSYTVDDIRVRICRAAQSPQKAKQATYVRWLRSHEKNRNEVPKAPWFPPVLVQGPAGCGKQVVAESIHRIAYGGQLKGCAMIDCLGDGESLYVALFGRVMELETQQGVRYETQPGALAFYGTVILDRIGRMPERVQRALDQALTRADPARGITAEVLPKGASSPEPVSGRIVALSGADLRELSARDEFRSSLYYKLSSFLIRIPRLDDHRQDVAALAQGFWRRLLRNNENAVLDDEAIAELQARAWPGNGRELEHVLQSCAERFPNDWRLTGGQLRRVLEDRYHQPIGAGSGAGRTAHAIREFVDALDRASTDIRALGVKTAEDWARQSLASRTHEIRALAGDPCGFESDELYDAAYEVYVRLKRFVDELHSNRDAALRSREDVVQELERVAKRMLHAGS